MPDKKIVSSEVTSLLLELFFPFCMSANLDENHYDVINGASFFTSGVSESGNYEVFLEKVASAIHPEYRGHFIGMYARESLYTSIARQEKSLSLDCTLFGHDEVYHWIRVSLVFINPKERNSVQFAMFIRAIDDEKRQEFEAANLKKVFEMLIGESFEYIALINTTSGIYEMIARSSTGVHSSLPLLGDYMGISEMIAELIPKGPMRNSFMQKANISDLLKAIKSPSDVYRFSYKIKGDDAYEISYRQFNAEKTQLLMSICMK
ncbi:MAG: hypothetical protein FWG30_02380 [Eubacteriaceae bacterium]|nr:hypothetical protein [Eubacteriaceae bacterium]